VLLSSRHNPILTINPDGTLTPVLNANAEVQRPYHTPSGRRGGLAWLVSGSVAAYTVGVQEIMRRIKMAWTTPTLVEICIGLEINGYLPAEF
jgi:coenzyme PQQ precursor peptide PqqA